MRNIIITMLLAAILASCASTRKTEAEKQAEAMAIKAMIADSTANRTFTVEVEYVVPRRMESRFLTSTYTVRISGDSIMSNLPYYGVAYKASFEREGPLDFDGHIDNYTISYPKEGITRVKLFTRNKLERLEYIFDIMDDGDVSLDVFSADRDRINFTGEMVLRNPSPNR